jgi:hypothetical protein
MIEDEIINDPDDPKLIHYDEDDYEHQSSLLDDEDLIDEDKDSELRF